ncbi:hypothetical protein [Priestia megaterium]|uniref:hypothetical protein n=1 Tax=Priestia megaterium TaxID=1404 RepID=UPI00263BAAD0|nr:hypothetical protein [Priestia megaterium]MDN4862809.1 hypothetical protein [Priestia megaterium]
MSQIILEGKHTCEECNKEFEWFYLVPEHMDSRSFEVARIPKGKQGVRVIEEDKNRMPITISAYCADDDCGTPNTFKIDKK